jgi:hypothetical protein
MLYGALAQPVGVACHSQVPLDAAAAAGVKVGMCFTAPTCNVSEQLTCHRYYAEKIPTVTGTKPAASIKELISASESLGQDNQIPPVSAPVILPGAFLPVRLRKQNGYYKVFSSIYDGNITDTFM